MLQSRHHASSGWLDAKSIMLQSHHFRSIVTTVTKKNQARSILEAVEGIVRLVPPQIWRATSWQRVSAFWTQFSPLPPLPIESLLSRQKNTTTFISLNRSKKTLLLVIINITHERTNVTDSSGPDGSSRCRIHLHHQDLHSLLGKFRRYGCC